MTSLTHAVLLLGFAAGLVAIIVLASRRPARHRVPEPKPKPGDVRMCKIIGGLLRVDIAHDFNGSVLWVVRYIGSHLDEADAAYREAIAESKLIYPTPYHGMQRKEK